MNTRLRRGLAGVAVAGMTTSLLGLGTGSAQGATDPAPARAAAAWLVGNLTDDALLEITSEFGTSPNPGSTIDLANALDAVGGHDAVVDRIADAVEGVIPSYTGDGEEIYAGATGKAAALLLSRGRDTDRLVERLESTVQTTGAAAGRIVDASQWGDYANTLGQAFAVNALHRADSDLAEVATGFLLAQQCEAGFFRLDLAREPMDENHYSAPDLTGAQSCDAAARAIDPEQSPDTTALVALQLAPLAAGDADVAKALDAAGEWLTGQQRRDGAFEDPQNGPNTNSTGLAGWALDVLGHDTEAARAAAWVRARQVVRACAPALLRNDAGAIAYNDLAWTNGALDGLADASDRSQWVIADTQALPALLAAPTAAASDAVVLPKFAKAGSTVKASVRGLAAGERGCTSGAVVADLLGTGGNLSVTLPKVKAGSRTLALTSASGTVRGTVKVLGAKKLTVKTAKTAKRGSKKTVTVKGLAAGEKVTVRFRGKKVKSGTATAKGTFTAKVKIGTKRGAAKVAVTGHYAHRKGSAKVKVK